LRVVPVRLAGCEGGADRASRLACTEAIAMELFVIWALAATAVTRGLTGLAGTQRYGLEHAAAGEGVQMPGKRHDDEPVCGCYQGDVRCVALTVGQLSQERVRELAEEIWAASTGGMLPAGPIPDPRRSRPGACAQAAYRRHRQLEREAWRPRWAWRAGAAAGRGSMDRRRDRRIDRRDHGRLAGLASRAAGRAADRVAASLPSLRQD